VRHSRAAGDEYAPRPDRAGRQTALAVKQLGQALARHILHHQVELFGVGAAVEHGHDVGMLNRAAVRASLWNRFHGRRVLGVGRGGVP
jgi:hypothetical protein